MRTVRPPPYQPTFWERFINELAADVMGLPRTKVPLFSISPGNSFGRRVLTSPGARIFRSVLEDECMVGMGVRIEGAHLERGVRCGVNSTVSDCRVGANSVIGASAVVTEDVPPNSLVLGENIIRPLPRHTGHSNRKVYRKRYPRNPAWYYWQLAADFGVTSVLRLVWNQAVLNELPARLHSSRLRQAVSGLVKQGPGAVVDPSVVFDPWFPELTCIGEDATIAAGTIVITHSFVNLDPMVFEWGPNSVGPGATIGRNCSVLPGVDVPADVHVPNNSICTAHGVWIVPESRRVLYEDLV